MIIISILQWFTPVFTFAGRCTMRVFTNWWRNRWINHIKNTITNENIRVKASLEGQIPQLNLLWNIVNRSMTNVAITEIFGSLYVGSWRIGTFDMRKPVEKKVGYSWSPPVTVSQTVLSKPISDKHAISQVEVILFPPTEFWLSDNEYCSFYDGNVRVIFFKGDTLIEVKQEKIEIEDVKKIATSYRNNLKTKLGRLLSKES